MSPISKKNLDLSPKKRALLDKLIQAEGLGAPTSHTIPERRTNNSTQKLPLSFAQEAIWLVDQLEPGSAVYNVPCAVRLLGDLNVEGLRQSLNEIVRRHEVLRTSFPIRDGEPVQEIQDIKELDLEFFDIQALKPTECELLFHEETRRGFHLEAGIPIRARLMQLGGQEF